MRISSLFLLIISLNLTSNVNATITCSKPKLSKAVGQDSIYHFKAVVECKLVGEPINLKTIKDSFRDEIMDKKSQFVVHDQHPYDDKHGMTGYWLNVTQSYKTDHGPLTVKAEILLLDDTATKFYMELRSKSVVGQDDAALNKSILNTTSLQHFPDHDELTVVKEIDVEEPWYAPHGYFMDTVQTELASSIRKSALDQANKIRGDKIDALRK